jgi:uncharacterized delta-60 repeat protein
MKTIVRMAALVAVLFLVAPLRIYAAPGDLDATFNPPNGLATYDGGSGEGYGRAVATQSDGKIVTAGTTRVVNLDFLVLRYDTDGTLDATFDGDGVAIYDGGFGDDQGTALAIQSDGKIVVDGYSANGVDDDVIVLRYDTDGTLDATFDGDGVAFYDGGSGNDDGRAMAIQSDGKILIAGGTDNGTDEDVLVVRLEGDDVPPEGDVVSGSSGGGCFISTLWPPGRTIGKGF